MDIVPYLIWIGIGFVLGQMFHIKWINSKMWGLLGRGKKQEQKPKSKETNRHSYLWLIGKSVQNKLVISGPIDSTSPDKVAAKHDIEPYETFKCSSRIAENVWTYIYTSNDDRIIEIRQMFNIKKRVESKPEPKKYQRLS